MLNQKRVFILTCECDLFSSQWPLLLFSSLSSTVVLHTDPGSYWVDWASEPAGRRYTQTGTNKQQWPPLPLSLSFSSPLPLWAVICEPAPPPPPPFGRSLYFLFFFFFLVEMSLGSCPPALKKTLPALLLSSVLLHCLIFHPSSLFVWNVLQQHHQLAPLLRKDLDVI